LGPRIHDDVNYRPADDKEATWPFKASTVLQFLIALCLFLIMGVGARQEWLAREQTQQGREIAILATNQKMVLEVIPELKEAIKQNTATTSDLNTALLVHEAQSDRIEKAVKNIKSVPGEKGEPGPSGPRGKNIFGR
jgi:hypothetical protein